jgi:uncharacterized protein (DUF433 family)
MTFERITTEPDKVGGVACIPGLRIPVATVAGMVAECMSVEQILADHPDLEAEDVREALRFAAAAVREADSPSEIPTTIITPCRARPVRARRRRARVVAQPAAARTNAGAPASAAGRPTHAKRGPDLNAPPRSGSGSRTGTKNGAGSSTPDSDRDRPISAR